MKGKYIFTLAVSTILLTGVLSYRYFNDNNLYRLLLSAENSQQIEIKPLIINQATRPIISRALFANISGFSGKKSAIQKEYVLRDGRNGNIFKILAEPSAPVINQLKNIKDVQLEEDINFSNQQLATSPIITSQADSIADELNQILESLNLTKFQGSFESQMKDSIKVAIIDSGFYDPNKYAGKIAINIPEQIGSQRFDDDENGYIDDIYGWDVLNNYPQVSDLSGHGTHLAGIIMAFSELLDNNASGIKIIPIQVLNANNEVKLSELLLALEYAQKRNSDYINMSLGSPDSSRILQIKLNELINSGVTVVAPAGNNNSNQILYPANYPNIIAVGALDGDNQKAEYSNYGVNLDISTKGSVLSFGQSGLIQMDGTSQATGIVTGLCSVLKASQGINGSDCLEFLHQNSLQTKTLIPEQILSKLGV